VLIAPMSHSLARGRRFHGKIGNLRASITALEKLPRSA